MFRFVNFDNRLDLDFMTEILDNYESRTSEMLKVRRKFGYRDNMAVYMPTCPDGLREAISKQDAASERYSGLYMVSPTLFRSVAAIRRLERKYMKKTNYQRLLPDIPKVFDYLTTIYGREV